MHHLTSLKRPSSSQVLPPPVHNNPPNPTKGNGEENRLLLRDPEFYQFDRGDHQKRGGREKNEGTGLVAGGGKAAGQMIRPTESPFYPDFLLEEDTQQGGIRGRGKYSSSQSNPPSISFPSLSFKEAESPVQATAKAEGDLWNKKSNNVDSGWQPSLVYVTPTKKEYDYDKIKTLKNEWELGGNLRQSIKEGTKQNNNNLGYNDVVNNEKFNEKEENPKGENETEYTETEGGDFSGSLSTLLTGNKFANL